MLENISGRTRECLLNAEECARRAATQNDPQLREDYLKAEQRWLTLARSVDIEERVNRFIANAPLIIGLRCQSCQRVGSAFVSRGPPFTVQSLSPAFRVVQRSTTRQGTKVGCQCGQLIDL